jgi:Flp pilus assembly protein TadD
MKKYRDEYDDENDSERETFVTQEPVVVDKLSFSDYVFAASLGGVVFCLLMLWSFPVIEPSAWQDAAEAVGTRPPQNLFPGLWRVLAAGVFKVFSVSAGLSMLSLLGKVSVAVSTGFAYLTFREIMALTLRLRLQYSRARYFVARLAAGVGALLFAFSDPVWRAGQFFSPVTFLVLLAVFGMYLFFAFLQGGSLLIAYCAMFVLGVLSADSPMGILLLALCWGVYFMAARHVLSFEMPLMNPFIEQVSKWHMTFLFVFGMIGGIVGNCFSFAEMGGMDAVGLSVGDLPLKYGLHMWSRVTSCASLMGWVIAFGVVVAPTVVCIILLPRAADEEQFLPYHIGAVYLFAGLLSLAQFCQVDALWFWTWISKPTMVTSNFLLCMFMFALSATTVFSLAVLGIDTLCRNHRRLALQRYADMRQDIESRPEVVSPRVMQFLRRLGVVAVPLIILGSSLPGRHLGKAREMMSILSDYAVEVVEECGPVKWLFTDGSFDPLLEVVAAVGGREVRPVGMIDRNNSPYEAYLRMRGVSDAEDKLSMEVSGGMALRSWLRDKKERLVDVAIQLGFDIWKRDGHAIPPCSGLVSRPVGMDEADCARGVAHARALGARVLEFYAKGGPPRNAGPRLIDLFLFVQWRIARIARMRAEREDNAGNAQGSLEDVALSEQLDEKNASLKRILEGMEKARQIMSRQITPREGLQMALTRADFALARRYAEPILKADPDEPQANFGMGMSYFVQEQWTRAEAYLMRCLIRNPKEPAIYNNLAVLQMKTGRFDAAEKNARRALELIPESAEVQDTLKQVLKAREDAEARARKAKKKAEEARRRAEEDD